MSPAFTFFSKSRGLRSARSCRNLRLLTQPSSSSDGGDWLGGVLVRFFVAIRSRPFA